MKKLLSYTLFIFIEINIVVSQHPLKTNNLVLDSINIKAYDEDDALSKYKIVHTSFLSFDDPSYIAPFPYIASTKKRRIELRDNEKSNTNIQFLEANINLKYIIASGRESSKGFYRRMQGTINYRPAFRMYLNSNTSNPTTPTNQDIGLGCDINLYNSSISKGNGRWIFKDTNRHDKMNPDTDGKTHLLNLYISAAHYSNGQENGFYFSVDSTNKRNDYRSGDFSTNYYRIMLAYCFYNYSTQNPKFESHLHRMYQVGLGFQRDGSFPGGFTEEQNYSYGKLRLLFKLDIRLGPNITCSPFDFRGQRSKVNYVTKNNEKIEINRLLDQHIMIKSSHIVGDLQNFNPNLLNEAHHDYRWNFEIVYEAVYYRWRNLGLFAKYYVGRDYLNIRYDDIIHIGMIGITANFKKYRAPMWLPKHANY